jgi:hypothetical protein
MRFFAVGTIPFQVHKATDITEGHRQFMDVSRPEAPLKKATQPSSIPVVAATILQTRQEFRTQRHVAVSTFKTQYSPDVAVYSASTVFSRQMRAYTIAMVPCLLLLCVGLGCSIDY